MHTNKDEKQKNKILVLNVMHLYKDKVKYTVDIAQFYTGLAWAQFYTGRVWLSVDNVCGIQ